MELLNLIKDIFQNSAGLQGILSAYFLGAIPFGFLIAKYYLNLDIRQHGSGNIGMTNVMRTGGKGPGIATFILDLGKGSLAVWIASSFLSLPFTWVLVAAFLVVFGHTKSIFLKFGGGKGVATNFGVLLVLDWRVFLASVLTWAILFGWKKISSLSALASLLAFPISTAIFHGEGPFLWFSLALSSYVILLHHENIRRLLSGGEGKLSSKK